MRSIYSVAARLNSIDTNFINKYSQKEELCNIAASQQSQVLCSTKDKIQFLEQFHRFLIIQRCLFTWHLFNIAWLTKNKQWNLREESGILLVRLLLVRVDMVSILLASGPPRCKFDCCCRAVVCATHADGSIGRTGSCLGIVKYPFGVGSQHFATTKVTGLQQSKKIILTKTN